MMQYTNFDNVKVGDLVKYNTRGFYSRTVIGKVSKVTAAQFAVGANRFRKSDGKLIGESFIHCQPATTEDLQRQQAEQYQMRLRSSIEHWFQNSNNTAKLTVAQLEAIKNIITTEQ